MADDRPLLATGKPHVSYSEWKDFNQCSWRFKLKHVQKINLDPRGVETIVGTCFHRAVEKLVRREPPATLDELREIALKELEQVAEGEDKAAFDVEWCASRAAELAVEGLAFLDQKFPGWKLVQAEERLYESFSVCGSRHEDVTFKGFVDLVFEAADGKTWIVDWKTSNRPWGKEKLMDVGVTYQLSMYKSFWAAKHNVPLDKIRCAYFVGLKKAKPGKAFDMKPVSVGSTTSKRTLTVLDNFVGSVKSGMAIKNKSEKNCKWCEYNKTEWCP